MNRRAKPLAETSIKCPRCKSMDKQPTIAQLAQSLVRQLYESSNAGSKLMSVVTTTPAAKAALELAVDNGWVVVKGDQDVRLTDTGRAVVKKGFS